MKDSKARGHKGKIARFRLQMISAANESTEFRNKYANITLRDGYFLRIFKVKLSMFGITLIEPTEDNE